MLYVINGSKSSTARKESNGQDRAHGKDQRLRFLLRGLFFMTRISTQKFSIQRFTITARHRTARYSICFRNKPLFWALVFCAKFPYTHKYLHQLGKKRREKERGAIMASRALWASRAASYLRISTFYRAFSTVLKDLKYNETHEWVKVDGDSATVGITDHAQDHLGDVVYVELPELGRTVAQGANFGAVESVKATSDVISPVSGEIVEVNEQLSESPGLVNASPYEKGWIIKVKLSDAGELNSLMDSDKYNKFCEDENAKH